MIRINITIVVMLFLSGLLAGFVLYSPPSSFINYDDTYSTIEGGYISDDLNVLEMLLVCNSLKTRVPKLYNTVIRTLNAAELLLNVPSGGAFILIKEQKSHLFPQTTFVLLRSRNSGVEFWIQRKWVRKIKTEEDTP